MLRLGDCDSESDSGDAEAAVLATADSELNNLFVSLELPEYSAEEGAGLVLRDAGVPPTKYSESEDRVVRDPSPPPVSLPPEPKPLGIGDFSVLDLITAGVLDADYRTGRPQSLAEEQKDRLVATVKRGFKSR